MGLGIFGGAFDPVHNGHLFVAEAVREACGLSRVLFVPTRTGRHRQAPLSAAPAARADMIRLAIAANTTFALDETDLADAATGFTADLLPRLAERYPGEELTFIVGGDSLVHSRWERLDAILDRLAAFVIAPRGEVTQTELDAALEGLAPNRRAKVRYLDLPLVAESATLIRARLAERKSVRYLVPEPVYRYIEENGLYR
ncbi:MAG: nicotinate (nicotinamide) nucleotide adenylyltransferase [Candidatus Lustribacter sp.]|jgi:nicotinate-nucleotide adenylyltransferase